MIKKTPMLGSHPSSLFLALDTSFEKGSVGLFHWKKLSSSFQKKTKHQQNIEILAFREWSAQNNTGKPPTPSHSEKLIPEILSTLGKAGKTLSQLNFLAVSTGPGRFTGVRTAVNTARALSFSLKVPCYPFNSLQLTAESFLEESPTVTVAFNSFKNSVYFAEFSSSGKEQTTPCTLFFPRYLEQMTGKTLCVGDVPHFYTVPPFLKKACEFKNAQPSVKNLTPLLTREFNPKDFIPWFKLQPLYLRDNVAKVQNKSD